MYFAFFCFYLEVHSKNTTQRILNKAVKIESVFFSYVFTLISLVTSSPMDWEMLPFSIDSSTMRRMHNENWQVHGFPPNMLAGAVSEKGEW